MAPTTGKAATSARTSHVARAPRAYAPRPCSTARSASPLCTSRSAASMSGDICRSPSHGRTCLRTSACLLNQRTNCPGQNKLIAYLECALVLKKCEYLNCENHALITLSS